MMLCESSTMFLDGFVHSQKSSGLIGLCLITSKFSYICSNVFEPMRVAKYWLKKIILLFNESNGIDLINCKWRAMRDLYLISSSGSGSSTREPFIKGEEETILTFNYSN